MTSAVVILLVIGLLLLIAEMFIPGGIVGAIGGILLVIAVGTAFSNNPTEAAILAVILTVGIFVGFSIWLKIFPKLPWVKKLTLDENLSEDWHGCDPEQETLMGEEGVALTDLVPSGFANLQNKRIDVTTTGDFINKGDKVRVVEVEGNRIAVEKI